MYIIDRFEGDFAVLELESKEHISVLSSTLYSGAKEGDVLVRQGEKYILSEVETRERRARNIALQNELFE